MPAGWSVLTASAHKWGGPPGVGLLVVRKGTRWESPWPADERESGRTPGVVNLPAVVAAAASLRAAAADAAAEAARLAPLVDRIRDRVAAEVPDVEVVGDPVDRLPHLVTFSCLYVDGEALLHALDRRGLRGLLRLLVHLVDAAPVARAGGDGGAVARQRPGLAAPGDTEADVERFLAELPRDRAPTCAPRPGVVGL